ncbi:MAG: hypothetical protein RIC89_19130 [Pseudomonadales bacterium]
MKLLDITDRQASKLKRARDARNALAAKRDEVTRSPRARDEVRALIEADLDRQAARCGAIQKLQYYGYHGRITDPVELSPTLVIELLGRDQVIDKLTDLAVADGSQISSAEMTDQLSDLDAQLFELEQKEEREALALEDDGWVIERREDVDPTAVLSVWEEQYG